MHVRNTSLTLSLYFSLSQSVKCDEIRKQALAVHATCRPIMNTPKPTPKPVDPPKEEAKAGAEGDAAAAAAGGEAKEGEAPAAVSFSSGSHVRGGHALIKG